MPAVVWAGLSRTQKPRVPSWLALWLAGAQMLGLSSTGISGATSGRRVSNNEQTSSWQPSAGCRHPHDAFESTGSHTPLFLCLKKRLILFKICFLTKEMDCLPSKYSSHLIDVNKIGLKLVIKMQIVCNYSVAKL